MPLPNELDTTYDLVVYIEKPSQRLVIKKTSSLWGKSMRTYDIITPLRDVNSHIKCKLCGNDIQQENKRFCDKCLSQ